MTNIASGESLVMGNLLCFAKFKELLVYAKYMSTFYSGVFLEVAGDQCVYVLNFHPF